MYGTPPVSVKNGETGTNQVASLQRITESGDFTSLNDVSTILYIGYRRRFDALVAWTVSEGDFDSLIWEYGDSEGTWHIFVPFQPRQDLFKLSGEYAEWNADELVDWSENDIGGENLYWIRITPVSPSDPVTIDALTIRPYTSIVGPADVQHQLQLDEEFSEDTLPSFRTVEQYIRGAEDGLFHITGHYYRPEFVEEELLNFKAFGMYIRNRPILDMLGLEVHTGSNWISKTEGRNQDWHYDPYTGMIYIATIFLDVVPPILRRGFSERRNQGAFKRAVRIRYAYGHDAREDRFSVEVGRIITKQASLDILANYDFARLLPQSLDRVTLQDGGLKN